jgi:hypothetical protein
MLKNQSHAAYSVAVEWKVTAVWINLWHAVAVSFRSSSLIDVLRNGLYEEYQRNI